MRLIPRTLNVVPSPISSAQDLIKQYQGSQLLIDLSQGTPSYPTARVVADHIAKVVCTPDGSKYTSRQGLDTLRNLVANELSQTYAGSILPDQVMITAGCNQAFCCVISAIADKGDEVILPVPYYFNHDMWLRLDSILPTYLTTAPHFIPDPKVAETLITERTKAIILVTPGNPTGKTIPPTVIHAFADLAIKYQLILVIDETYRVFRNTDEPAHLLFSRDNWSDNVVSLHSFSKEFAIPGHRVGAAIGHPDLIVEMMKLFDCMAICAPRLGQEAAIVALESAVNWRHNKVVEIREKQELFESVFTNVPGGFELCAAGAFYGWVKHPVVGTEVTQVVLRLFFECGLLVLPGTIFSPLDEGYLRFSYGNLTHKEIEEVGQRLSRF